MEINDLINRIKIHLESILNERGAIVFSSANTISKGDMYSLGLNPGGEINIPIKKTLCDLPYKQQNAYVDEAWEIEKIRHICQVNIHYKKILMD